MILMLEKLCHISILNRSIELGVPVVQSANNGISGIILPSGEVLVRSEIDVRNVYNRIIKIK